jgi:hypothetical protein
VERFLDIFPMYRSWNIELVGVAPRLDGGARAVLLRHDVRPQDPDDLTRDLA